MCYVLDMFLSLVMRLVVLPLKDLGGGFFVFFSFSSMLE